MDKPHTIFYDLRIKKNLTAQQLSDEFKKYGYNISRSTIAKLDNAEPSQKKTPRILEAYENYFGVDSDKLLGKIAPEKTGKPNLKSIMRVTGLSENSIRYLYNADETERYILNRIIENGYAKGIYATIFDYYKQLLDGTLYIEYRDGHREIFDGRQKIEYINNERKGLLHGIVDSIFRDIDEDAQNPIKKPIKELALLEYLIKLVKSARNETEEKEISELVNDIQERVKTGIYNEKRILNKLDKIGNNASDEQKTIIELIRISLSR